MDRTNFISMNWWWWCTRPSLFIWYLYC